MATHSSILTWKIPWTEEPGRLQSMGLQRVGHDSFTCLFFLFVFSACMCAKSLQSCLTLCDSMDWSPPGSSVHGFLLPRTLEWVAWPPPGDLPNTEIEPACPMSPALAGVFFTISATWEAPLLLVSYPKNNCQTKVKEIFPYVSFL